MSRTVKLGEVLELQNGYAFKSKEYIIDVSGALEDSSGKKSIKKINHFLIEINKA